MRYALPELNCAAHLRNGSMVALLSLAVPAVFFVPFSVAPTSAPAKIAQDVLLSLVLLTGVESTMKRGHFLTPQSATMTLPGTAYPSEATRTRPSASPSGRWSGADQPEACPPLTDAQGANNETD
jgi:hypothetical protein